MKQRVVVLVALIALSMGVARADFVSEAPTAPATVATAAAAVPAESEFRAVAFVGARAAVTPSVGGARRFGVLDAIGQFAPAGWRVQQAGANLAGTVDWVAAPDWIRTLDSVLTQSGNEAQVFWADKKILITKAKSGVSVEQGAAAPTEWVVRAEDQWVLATVLPRWASDAGVNLVIDRKLITWDYPVSAPATFRGDFETAVGDLLASIASTSDRPARAVFHGSAGGGAGAQAIEIRPLND